MPTKDIPNLPNIPDDPDLDEICNMIRQQALFLDPVDRQRRGLNLSAVEKRKLCCLIQDQQLDPAWLRRYQSVLGGDLKHCPIDYSQSWWMYLTVREFASRCFLVRRELECAELKDLRERRRQQQLTPINLEGWRRAIVQGLADWRTACAQIKDPATLRSWLLDLNNSAWFSLLVLLFVRTLEMPAGLDEEVVARHQSAAKTYLCQVPEALLAGLKEAPDLGILVGLSPAEIETARMKVVHNQTAWLTQGLMIERRLKQLSPDMN